MKYIIRAFLLLLFSCLNVLALSPVYSHQAGNAIPRPTVINHLKETEEYRTTLSYYPVGDTGVFDFTVRVEKISSGYYYNQKLEFKVVDPQGIERISYRPFLDNESNYRMRQVLEDEGQYLFIVQFNWEGREQEISFPLKIEKYNIENMCPWCLMLVTNIKTAYFLTMNDGDKKTCCIHCALSYRNKFSDKFLSMKSVDYYSEEIIDSQNAWYINDPDITLEDSMPPYVVAFSSIESARDFQKAYDGEIVDINRLEYEVLRKKDPEFSSEEDEDVLLLENLILKIKNNYYKDTNVKKLIKSSIKSITTSLDQHSSLKEIKPSSSGFIRGFERAETISGTRIINDNIGYIKIEHFGRRTKEGFTKALADLKDKDLCGLILDLRDNPGGSLEETIPIMELFISEGKLLLTVESKGQTKYFSRNDEVFTSPLVILINSNTASCAEIFATTLRYYQKAILVGTNSYGKGTIQKIFPLDYKHSLVLTIGEFYLADGTSLQGAGVKPDYVVEGNDEQVKFAIELINKW
ncbi:MAG: S41 family peptidase [Candidatus Scalindua sp.]|nr:S41 family peptidase [Candidatus Scalindua sp.]MDV5166212.1 S41 family peptidase [Candidatus Scalindua sp.]